MGEEMCLPEASKESLGCNHHTIRESKIHLEGGEAREEPQDVLPSSLESAFPEYPAVVQQTDREGLGDPKPFKAETVIPSSCLTEMDCPVCFSRYDIYRLPKELSCKHSFCAICLKLLVRNEAGSWMVACPICRTSTMVFGGLVCTLQNQELLMSNLQNPEVRAIAPEGSRLSEIGVRLDLTGATQIMEEETNARHWTAAKRMVVLLLMLLIVLIVILQFIYTGIMKWMLGCALGVVVIITLLLCFNPYWKLRLLGARTQQKDDRSTAAV